MSPKQVIYLDNTPFNATSIVRATADDLVSRFGSPEQGETNLDFFRVFTQKSFKGGMFQRVFEDDSMVSTATGCYYNPIDQKLYFAVSPSTDSVSTAFDFAGIRSWAYYKGFLYITVRLESPSARNAMYRVDLGDKGPAFGLTEIDYLPDELKNSPDSLRFTSTNTYMFVTQLQNLGNGERKVWRFTGAAFGGPLVEYYQEMVFFNDKLYGVGVDNVFTQITGAVDDVAAHTVIGNLDRLPGSYEPTYQTYKVYNGALYFGMTTGLWRYDGVSLKLLFDYRQNAHADNFKYMSVWNGRLYYTIKNSLYVFDGINVQLVNDFTKAYIITDLQPGTDRLWISALSSTGIPYSDKFQTGTIYYNVSLFCYNGIGFFEYYTLPSVIAPFVLPKIIPLNDYVHVFVPQSYYNGSGDVRSNGFYHYSFNLRDEYTLNGAILNRKFQIVSSDITNEYPSVAKVLCGTKVDYTGFDDSYAYLTLEYQAVSNSASTSWTTVWDSRHVVAGLLSPTYYLADQSLSGTPTLPTVPQLYDRIRYRLTGTLTGGNAPSTIPAVRTASLFYTLQPRFRRKWLITIAIDGLDNSGLDGGSLDDGSDQRHNNYLRSVIYRAYANKKPVLFYDTDYSTVKAISPLKLRGTDMFTSGETLAFNIPDTEAWLNRRVNTSLDDDVNDDTTITLSSVGSRQGVGGSSAAGGTGSIVAGIQVRRSHVCYVKQITNENLIIDPDTMNDKNNYSDMSSTITIMLVEV